MAAQLKSHAFVPESLDVPLGQLVKDQADQCTQAIAVGDDRLDGGFA
jgi:hypothetical protein